MDLGQEYYDSFYDHESECNLLDDPSDTWLSIDHLDDETKPCFRSYPFSPAPSESESSSDQGDTDLPSFGCHIDCDLEDFGMANPPPQDPQFPIHAGTDSSDYSGYVTRSVQSVYIQEYDERPRFTTADTNIFIRSLTLPIPNDRTVEPEYREPLYRNLPAPDNYMESISDEYLPHYFINQYGTDTGTLGFPNIYGVMYAQSWTNPVLRHACLAVASFWAGRKAGNIITNRSAVHINFLLPELQRVIRSRQFDDGHLCAVYMLMSFALDTNRFGVMQKHGAGLVLMLRHLGYLRSTVNGRYTISDAAPPLVVHVWRLALRDDTMCGFGGPGYYKMCLPSMEVTGGAYERCMTSFLDQQRSHLKQIKRQLVIKDLLAHRLLHFQNRVSSIRATAEYRGNVENFEQQIQRRGKREIEEILIHRQRISQQYLRPSATRPVRQFLHYAPFYTSVWDSYCLFIYNSQTYINATLILDPTLGRSEKFPERTTAAIDLCRAIAAREKHLSPQAASLCFAGLAFIGDYPRELSWVEQQLGGLMRRSRPCPGLYLDILEYLKEHPAAPWQEVWLEIMSDAIP